MVPPGPTDVGAFAEGSVSNADFRGKAPAATLFSMNENNPDYVLQTNAALLHAPISNNSWNYGGDYDYDLAAASYDAAVRDAVPGQTGSQPVLFVFSAGNDGNGDNDGENGNADSILSPGTAKNVITVGSLEELRLITNIVTTVTDGATNQTEWWKPWTDFSTQVAWFSSRGNVGMGTEGHVWAVQTGRGGAGDICGIHALQPVGHQRVLQPDEYMTRNRLRRTVAGYQLRLVYYNISVPPNAVGVNITISPTNFRRLFPPNLPIYVQHLIIPTRHAPGGIDISPPTTRFPSRRTAAWHIIGIQTIQNIGL